MEGQRKSCRMEGGKKIPPGPIKCLINSRRRIGRNNEHLSESFIACETRFPAFSHLIFTTGLGRGYYHYLHFIGEERKAPVPPSWAGQPAHLGVQRCRDVLVIVSPQIVTGLRDKSKHFCALSSQKERASGEAKCHLLQGP